MTRKNIIARTVSSNNKIVSSRFFEQSNFEQMIMTQLNIVYFKDDYKTAIIFFIFYFFWYKFQDSVEQHKGCELMINPDKLKLECVHKSFKNIKLFIYMINIFLQELGFSRPPDFVPPITGRNDASRHRVGCKDQEILFRRWRENFEGKSGKLQTSGSNSN